VPLLVHEPRQGISMAKPIKPNKFLFGDDTANTLNGTNDGESIFGLAANDTLSAWGGSDDVSGGNGNDIVNGGKGNDRLFGEAGNDTLVGEDGNDVLLGGDGDDVLLGGRGVDVFDGGAGSDKFLISRGDGVDTIRNFASTDRIDLGAFHFDSAQAVLAAFKQVLLGRPRRPECVLQRRHRTGIQWRPLVPRRRGVRR
jgi:Ca2+-binding RTX toxin-like protein